MNHLQNLNLMERLALWVLARSPRISLVVVKEADSSAVFVAADPRDPAAAFVADGLRDEEEPASMLLERLYHAPAYGELA
jgi:hypothetical protein